MSVRPAGPCAKRRPFGPARTLAPLALALGCMVGAHALHAPPASAHVKCGKGEYYSTRFKRCRKLRKKAAPTKQTDSERTVSPGAVGLSGPEREAFETINKERAEHQLKALSTSPALQAIAEKRAREMAASHSDYAGHDVYLDLKASGICTLAEREVSGLGVSAKAAARPSAQAAISQEGEAQIEEQIPVDPRWSVLAPAVFESAGEIYYVEDYAEGC